MKKSKSDMSVYRHGAKTSAMSYAMIDACDIAIIEY